MGRSSPCPLFPQKRTFGSMIVMSALCQKRTYAAQRNTCLFDHLICAQFEFPAYREPQRLRSLAVDDKFKFGRLLDRKSGAGFAPLRILST